MEIYAASKQRDIDVNGIWIQERVEKGLAL